MENTPSVAIRARGMPAAMLGEQGSHMGNVAMAERHHRGARDSRAPAHRQAWDSSSIRTRSSGPISAGMMPALAR